MVVGEIDGRITPRAERLHALLSLFDDKAVLTPNIWGYLWGKLAYGAMLFATALTDDSMADCFAASDRRPLFTALAREILTVAHAAGIRPEAFDGFDPGAYATMQAPPPRLMPWNDTTGTPPNHTAASGVISPFASAARRPTRSLAPSWTPHGNVAWQPPSPPD